MAQTALQFTQRHGAASRAIHWTLADHLDTPVLQSYASGALDWRSEQEPYGRVRTFRTGASRHQPLRFPGQECDDAVGDREYDIARWYREGLGRYTQGDPIGLNGGINPYGYTAGDPWEPSLPRP